LGKALRGRSSVLKRKASRVIDNMCRLVREPADVAPFIPLLLPALDKVIDEIVDAEVNLKFMKYFLLILSYIHRSMFICTYIYIRS
jgi:hypothetical protein